VGESEGRGNREGKEEHVRNVEFAYWIGDRVMDPFGTEGIVTMVAVDDGEKKTYYVKNSQAEKWWNESQLTKKEGA
jgi:hypothetical protein